jgi:uncharacterized membrane protein
MARTEVDGARIAPGEAAGVPDAPAPRRSNRIAGIDLARAFAIIGMIAAHVGPTREPGFWGSLYGIPSGRASILFVLIAGVGVSLLGRRAEQRTVTRLRLAWTALILLPLGLALQELDHDLWIVLHHYAALFLIGIAALSLPTRWLFAIGLAWLVIGPLLFVAAHVANPELAFRSGVGITDSPRDILVALVITGPYPMLTWAAPFLVGMAIGRLDLSAPRIRWTLVAVGFAATLAAAGTSWVLEAQLGDPKGTIGWLHLIDDDPHGQTPLWLIGSTGSAVLVFAFSLLLADRIGRSAWPLLALGQTALTVYIVHVLALHFAHGAFRSSDLATGAVILAVMVVVALIVAVLWRSVFARGPVEAAILAPFLLRDNHRSTL